MSLLAGVQASLCHGKGEREQDWGHLSGKKANWITLQGTSHQEWLEEGQANAFFVNILNRARIGVPDQRSGMNELAEISDCKL